MNSLLQDETYSATKAYAFRGQILDQQTLTSLTESLDVDELATKLKATAYDQAISRINGKISAKKIENACLEHVANIHYSLLKISPGTELLLTYYLKHIARNLKIILKGKALNKSDEELRNHINLYPEELIGRRDLIAKVLTAETLQDSVDSLTGSEFSKDITTAMKIYKENSQIDIFDVYIDKAYHVQLSNTYKKLNDTEIPYTESLGSKLKPIISYFIDSYNILSTLRAKQWKFEVEQIRNIFIQPTFDISIQKLKNMSTSENIESSIKMLETTKYKKLIPSSFTSDIDSISILENNLRKYEYKKFNKIFIWEAFSESVSLAIIRIKEFEASNIGTIAFGVENAIESKTIQENLIT